MMTAPATATSSETMSDTDTDRATVRLAMQGDRAAFALLHARYVPMVHGLLLTRVAFDDAADLVQEVFLQAWGRVSHLRDPDVFGQWLATISRNVAVTFHRRRLRAMQLPARVQAPEHRTPDDAARARAEEVLTVINTLPAAYRETLILRLVEGLTGPQIARCTGRQPGAVRVNLYRGFALLRERLGEDTP